MPKRNLPEGFGMRPTLNGTKPCECADPDCGACDNNCVRRAIHLFHRIDMDDASVRFCDECAGDAFTSGLFIDEGDL